MGGRTRGVELGGFNMGSSTDTTGLIEACLHTGTLAVIPMRDDAAQPQRLPRAFFSPS